MKQPNAGTVRQVGLLLAQALHHAHTVLPHFKSMQQLKILPRRNMALYAWPLLDISPHCVMAVSTVRFPESAFATFLR